MQRIISNVPDSSFTLVALLILLMSLTEKACLQHIIDYRVARLWNKNTVVILDCTDASEFFSRGEHELDRVQQLFHPIL
jgi:hypothetical protein